MTGNIRAVLSPLFIISYVFGGRIIEFSADEPKIWLGILFLLLLWLIYYFLCIYTIFHYAYNSSTMYKVCLQLEIFTGILSTFLGLYYKKELKNCLRKLAMVDNTLKKAGIMTNYQKLYRKVLLIVLGWFLLVMWKMCVFIIWYSGRYELIKNIYISFILDYGYHVNFVDDLIIASILRYIELKFDQVNEYLRKWEENVEHKIKRTCQNLMLLPHQTVFSKSKSNEYITWIVIHLHLELRRISRDLNSIFGLKMTVKIGIYFAFIVLNFDGIFNIMFIKNYEPEPVLLMFIIVTSLILTIFRLLLINCICERVVIKANITGNLMNCISYCSYDVVVRENISQLLLQINQAPFKFYGLGLFQFGLKFLHGFSSSVATIIIVLVQSHINT